MVPLGENSHEKFSCIRRNRCHPPRGGRLELGLSGPVQNGPDRVCIRRYVRSDSNHIRSSRSVCSLSDRVHDPLQVLLQVILVPSFRLVP